MTCDPAGRLRGALSCNGPSGGPSLISYSEEGLLSGPFLPGELPCPLLWASSMLTTLPIACCHP